MGYFIKFEAQTSEVCIAHFSPEIGREQLIKIVHDIYIKRGYKVDGGTPGNSVYVRGSRAMRILLGAFAKYFNFTISVSDVIDGVLKVGVKKNTSGMAGGIIGVQQVKHEFEWISNLLMRI